MCNALDWFGLSGQASKTGKAGKGGQPTTGTFPFNNDPVYNAMWVSNKLCPLTRWKFVPNTWTTNEQYGQASPQNQAPTALTPTADPEKNWQQLLSTEMAAGNFQWNYAGLQDTQDPLVWTKQNSLGNYQQMDATVGPIWSIWHGRRLG